MLSSACKGKASTNCTAVQGVRCSSKHLQLRCHLPRPRNHPFTDLFCLLLQNTLLLVVHPNAICSPTHQNTINNFFTRLLSEPEPHLAGLSPFPPCPVHLSPGWQWSPQPQDWGPFVRDTAAATPYRTDRPSCTLVDDVWCTRHGGPPATTPAGGHCYGDGGWWTKDCRHPTPPPWFLPTPAAVDSHRRLRQDSSNTLAAADCIGPPFSPLACRIAPSPWLGDEWEFCPLGERFQ